MKKVLSILSVFVFLTTVFSGSLVDAATEKTVTLTGEIVKINPGMPYNKDMLALKTANGNYILNGNLINQIGNRLNYTALVKGNIYTGPQGIQMLNAISFQITGKAIPTPKPVPTTTAVTQTPVKIADYVQLEGTLYNKNSNMYSFLLKAEKGIYELMGNTAGMEKECGKTIVVSGNYVYTFVPTEYPLFNVVSYKVIETPTVPPTPTPVTSPSVKTITIDNNGGYVYINKGDELKLILESNKTTGYSWNYVEKPDPSVLVQTSHEYITNKTSKIIDGAGGREVWTYKAAGSGTTIINLAYSRVWESIPPAKTFVIKVIVNDITTPVPTITSPNYETIKGTLIAIKNETPLSDGTVSYSFQLKTDKSLVTLNGNTAGMEKYDGYTVEVYGHYSILTIYPPIFIVESYKPIIAPTPTPTSQVVLKGILGVTKTIDSATGYRFELKTDTRILVLLGNTAGLEKYNGSTIEVVGNYSPLDIYPAFIVDTYKILEPSPTPTAQVVLKGSLTVTKTVTSIDPALVTYKFELKTETGPVTLQGNTKGLENYNGFTIEVTGTYSLLKIYPPIFLVDTYKIIEPTPVPVIKDHTVISEKALYLTDPEIGSSNTENSVTGYSTISWTEGTDKAFFKSKLKALNSIYEFELVAVKTSDSESIKGLFNIKRNGVLVAKEISGQLYGISQPVGSYFKFYSDDMHWHMSAYITKRLDF